MDRKIMIYLLAVIATGVLVIGGIQVKQEYNRQKAEAETQRIIERERQGLEKIIKQSDEDIRKESGSPNVFR